MVLPILLASITVDCLSAVRDQLVSKVKLTNRSKIFMSTDRVLLLTQKLTYAAYKSVASVEYSVIAMSTLHSLYRNALTSLVFSS